MAEVIGVIASVVGVSAAGFKVAQGLYKIADSISSAGEEVRLFATDTHVFSQMLFGLSQSLETSQDPSSRLLVTTADAVILCQQILEPFQKVIARLNPLLVRFRESASRLRQIGLRLNWIWKHKSKLVFYQKMLNSLKATLSCLLASMNLTASVDSRAERAEILRIQLENARGVVQHSSELPARNLLESSLPGSNEGGRVTQEREPTSLLRCPDEVDNDTLIINNSDIEGPTSRSGSSHRSVPHREDHAAAEDRELDRGIDDDLGGDLSGESGRTARALYDDIRALQRSILRFANESLESANSHARDSMADREDTSVMPSHPMQRTSVSRREHDSSSSTDRQSLSIIKPYQSLRASGSIRGLNLLELRDKSQILLEDTTGDFHYIPISVASTWQRLRNCIFDLFAHQQTAKEAVQDAMPLKGSVITKYVSDGSSPELYSTWICSRTPSTVHWDNPWAPSYKVIHTTEFTTEHGLKLTGNESEYRKSAFQRAIMEDAYRLEDHSGNAAHVGNSFRKENWHKRTWLNAQLLLRFDNPYFNEAKK